MLVLDGVADDTIAALLGLDRREDFERAEREHPDCLGRLPPSKLAALPPDRRSPFRYRLPLMLFAG